MSTKLICLTFFVLVLAVMGTASADQLTITIDNPGFEDPVLAEDDWTWLDVPGWTPVGGEGPGVWNVTSADFDPVIAPEGQNVLYTENAVSDAGGVAQVLTDTFAANTDYTLTAEVGNSWAYYWSGYSVQLLAGGTVIAEDNNTLWPDYMLWATSTVEYTYDPGDSGLVGQPLEIRLLNLGIDMDVAAPSVVGVEFDNVTLLYVASAEPEVTVPISNAGFEDPVLAEDDWTWIDVPGWTHVGGEGPGVWNVTSADFDPVVAPGGQNVLYTENAVGDAGGVAQVLTETFAANTDYTLTVEVGNSNYYYFSGYSAQLLAGGVVIAEDNDTLWPEYSKWATSTVEYTYNPADAALVGQPLEIRLITLALDKDNPPAGEIVGVEFDNVTLSYVAGAEPGVTIPVDPNSDLAAANALANPGDTILFAEGTYDITSQIEIKDGVTYQGAGAGLTIIDGNDTTRAFVAWGDRGATDGQVDANGVAIPNLTGPKDWVIDGMTIQNCVADANNRQDILSAARDLLNNYTGAPYTLAAAQEENGGVTDNPEWFDLLSGGADDDLTDVELQAYLDANPPGSAGHLVANDAMDTGGGALVLRNGAAGIVQNCSFLNNQALLNSGDGGAIMTGNNATALTIENCEFIGNSCDDGGGALRMNSGSACTITGTTFTENQAIGDSADGGAIVIANSGTSLTVDNCQFNGNSCVDGGGAIRLGGNSSVRTITGSTFTENYTAGDGGAIKCDGDDSTYVLTDCSFIGNTAEDDGGAVRYNPDRCEVTVTNCAFIGNDAAGEDGDGGAWHTGDDDAGPMTFENCLFADNTCTDDRIVEVRAAFAFLNCTFVGNVAGDEAILAIRGRAWDSTGDGDDDMTTDDSIISNCLFINNTLLSNKQIIGDTRNDVFAPTVTNCLFFGNLDQNEEPAENTDDNSVEVGTIDVSAVTDAAELVVDPAGDYHLAAGSPAIDASDPATATDADIEGTAAVGVRDVGAYESAN